MVTARQFDTGVFVAGGGPVGLAAAIAAADRGLTVTLADGCRPPLDKACGEGLMPDSLASLAALGISLDGADTARFDGIRFLSPGGCAEARFPNGSGRGVRRTLLHSLLLARAEALGVRFCWGSPVTGVDGEFVSLGMRLIRARWIVGADGLQSRIRRWAGLDQGAVRTRRIGLRRHYRIAPWSDFVEIYWGEHGQAYVTPVGFEQVCVAFIARAKHFSAERALDSFPELRQRLAGAVVSTSSRGALTLGRKLPQVTHGRVALVGDASGSVDAITGEGLALGFRQAARLADALAAGDLSGYEDAHRTIQRVPMFMSNTMLLMDRSRWLRDRALGAFESSPQLFARMLRVHVGAAPLTLFGNAGVLHLGWQLLTT
ncbi:MAG: NAD(P)/FAD-dependent oxidoreductase [Acidobacteriaceae bacterium]